MCEFIATYQFQATVPMEEVEASLVLAKMGTESLHGTCGLLLDVKSELIEKKKQVRIRGTATIGSTLNRLFLGFLRREFDPSEYTVTTMEVARPKSFNGN